MNKVQEELQSGARSYEATIKQMASESADSKSMIESLKGEIVRYEDVNSPIF